jgi:hypothetical protein
MTNKVTTFTQFKQAGRVKECTGSVLIPQNSGLKMVLAVCSQSGLYESPFFKMITKRYTKVKSDYREAFVTQQGLKLGNVNTTAITSETWVMQAVCLDVKEKLDKKALETCVTKLVEMAKYEKASLHVSNLLLQEVPALKKLLAAIPEAGLNLYLYDEKV